MGEKRVRDVRYHHADGAAAAVPQAFRRGVRFVIQLFGDLLDALGHFVFDAVLFLLAVEYERDERRGDARAVGDVFQGYSIPGVGHETDVWLAKTFLQIYRFFVKNQRILHAICRGGVNR